MVETLAFYIARIESYTYLIWFKKNEKFTFLTKFYNFVIWSKIGLALKSAILDFFSRI